MRAHGAEWQDDGEGWTARIGRFCASTWEFGPIHQCKVFVTYEHGFRGERVGICLEAQPTRNAAMKHGLDWIRRYKRKGAPSPESVFRDCYEHWPTLYRTRVDVLGHLFFVIGNGYAWLDGAVIYTGPEDHLRRQRSDNPDPGPKPDDGGERSFYPVYAGALVSHVPDDVDSAWLRVAFEAATLLRDRDSEVKNRKAGRRILRELIARFGALR